MKKIISLSLMFFLFVFISDAQSNVKPLIVNGQPAGKNFYDKGEKLALEKEYKKAIENFTKAIEADENYLDAYFNRAVCYKKMGNDSAACNDWQKAKALGDSESNSLLIKYCGYKYQITSEKDSILLQEHAAEDNRIFTIVEHMPQFPGGEDAFINYLSDNIRYPVNARKNKITGTVYVTFVVDKEGKISGHKVLKGVSEEIDAEAIRVLSEMPQWIPGTQNGKPVNVQYNVPLRFSL